ncbi:hypothetical protein THAOC_18532, partial [Thalassiosira oceanica]
LDGLLLARQGSEELRLLLGRLEASVSKLRTRVDELDVDALNVLPARVLHQGLSHDKRPLLHSHAGSLDHNPILPDNTVVDETTHGGDGLLGEVRLGLARGIVPLLSNAVNLLVHLGTVEVPILTSARDSVADAGGMPRTDTGDLAETPVGLAREASNAPSGGHALVSFSLSDAEDVYELVLAENGVNRDLLLEEVAGELDLVGGRAAVDLDLHDVGLLDTEVELLHLRVGDDADDLAELADALKLRLDGLSVVLGVLLGVFGVSLALALVPVLVASALELLAQVLGEHGGECAKAARRLEVSHDTDDDHGGGLEDGDGVDDLTLVHDGSWAVYAADDVGHTGLVGAEGRKVARGGGIRVLGEGADATGVVLRALLGEEPQVTAEKMKRGTHEMHQTQFPWTDKRLTIAAPRTCGDSFSSSGIC